MNKTIEELHCPSPPPATRQDCDPFVDSVLVKVIKTIAYSLLMIFSLVGNSLVIMVVYRNRKLRTIINFFILNMAISDLLTPLFAVPIRIKDIYFPRGVWLVDGIFGSVTCKALIFIEDLSLIVSVFTLEVIAVERFFRLVFPLKRQPINSKKTCFIIISLIWLVAALYPSIHFYKLRISHKETTPYCYVTWEPAFSNEDAIKVEYPIFLISCTILPFILLTSLYSAIIASLHRQRGLLRMASIARQRRAKKYRRVTYMLVTVVIVFFVTWTPLNIYLFLRAFVWRSLRLCDSRHLIFSALFLVYSYPAINPFIYYIFSRDYRYGFQKLLGSLIRWRPFCREKHISPVTMGNINYAVKPGLLNSVVFLSMRSLEPQ